ncbi:MAG: hypothetical protein JSW66_01960 [Phycisphaerales bacterium]|nr:MAG: hypothetical protein JSW66_01960 [Phycisphaerales bacterium]
MTESKPVTTRQRSVLEELFSSEQNEQEILDKYKVSRKLFNKWMSEPAFSEQLDRHSAAAHRRSALHLARHAPKAANKLVQLSQQDKGETARKACLDIISMRPSGNGATTSSSQDAREHSQLPAETAGRILASLTEEKAC